MDENTGDVPNLFPHYSVSHQFSMIDCGRKCLEQETKIRLKNFYISVLYFDILTNAELKRYLSYI